jgi:hypothetical protein
LDPNHKELFGGESAEKQKQYDDIFQAADENKDGKLDEEELFDMHNFNWMKVGVRTCEHAGVWQ